MNYSFKFVQFKNPFHQRLIQKKPNETEVKGWVLNKSLFLIIRVTNRKAKRDEGEYTEWIEKT